MEKRIGIDMQGIYGQRTGVGIYAESLFKALQEVQSDLSYIAIQSAWQSDLSTPKRFIYDQIEKPIRSLLSHIDLLHITGFSAPFLYPRKKIITCHDLIPLFFNISHAPFANIYWRHILYGSIKGCDGIIAVSEYTKKDLIRVLGIPEEKIRVIYNGIDDTFKPLKFFSQEDIERVKRKFNLPDRFVLYVGSIESRKNVERLIRVIEKLSVPLVVVGRTWKNAPLPSGKGVIATGYVSDFEKRIIYALARLFVFPSLYEGFGIPILEAMSAGIPVISSDSSSLPEVGGDAAIYFDPMNEEDMAEKILLIYNDEDRAKECIEKGYENTKRFDWRETARQTVEYYVEILEK